MISVSNDSIEAFACGLLKVVIARSVCREGLDRTRMLSSSKGIIGLAYRTDRRLERARVVSCILAVGFRFLHHIVGNCLLPS